MKMLLKQAALVFLFLMLLCGAVYPVIVTVIAQAAFHEQANGSIIEGNKGSKLIGQTFTEAKYLIGRPDDGAASNLDPTSAEAKMLMEKRVKALRKLDPGNDKNIPADLVTASASGVDPEISVAAANYQAERIARARNLPVSTVKAVFEKYTSKRVLGIVGEPVVNVLLVNLTLDKR
ncbi:K+-transporting ATPase subunit C [Listeria floridensis FSL S10-1187]|uniref:Potassium-transporting ATPase KdpC subunit n=1 Tax=Listeria floridensis FSL S10-1187 TaxID=1265817 RepID=A0ABN0RJ72_9LIST|nr:potassium-transporting ATPase subunit KdpC [Listeria floridensis]EUJ33949.1 K+-transporting ATPase subunit C [Listeria floridensis FSL S10-1187]